MVSSITSAKVASGLQSFGLGLHQGKDVSNPLLHQEETELVTTACQVPLYNYFRDYEPETGRYLSSDPIGHARGLNTYGYALQNPLTYTDPTGEAVPALIAACAGNPACATAVGAGVGAIAGALLDVGSQLLGNGGNLQCVNKSSVALSAGIGAIPGGAIGSKVLGKFVTKSVDPKTLIGRQGRNETSSSQVKRLRRNMRENGFDQSKPIEAADVDGKLIILDGHHRRKAAIGAGIKKVPVNVNKVTREQANQLLREAAESRL